MSFDFGMSATSDSIQNWINNEFQHYANKKEREFERDMSEEEYSRAVEMWNMTNTYNSPEEQRKRLEAAGLNPALMYGKGASPGIANPAPTWRAPESGHYGENIGFNINSNGLSGILNAYNDLRQTTADVALKEAAANKATNEGTIKNIIANMMLGNDVLPESVYQSPWYKKLVADAASSEAERKSKESKANFDQASWKMYDEQGIFLDQLTNAGKLLERKLGSNAAVILDAILGKVKNR